MAGCEGFVFFNPAFNVVIAKSQSSHDSKAANGCVL